jgi:predicted amidophosphoribosyltransferase
MRLPHKPVLRMPLKLGRTSTYSAMRNGRRAVRGAFATRPGSQVDNKRVLLLDDVVTTGATLDACAKVLLEAGAKSVVGLAVAAVKRAIVPSSMSEF